MVAFHHDAGVVPLTQRMRAGCNGERALYLRTIENVAMRKAFLVVALSCLPYVGVAQVMMAPDLVAKIPMRTDSIFQIMSMTKPVTAVGIMILMEEGREFNAIMAMAAATIVK
jgi:hypothetical protein